MPYQVYSENGKFCVHKKDGEQKGALVPGGCHAEQDKASAHMRALYAAENRSKKELSAAQEEMIVKELEEKGYDFAVAIDNWVPWNITTFEDLDAWREQQANAVKMRITINDLQNLINHTFDNPDISDKPGAVVELAKSFQTRISKEAKGEGENPPQTDNNDGMEEKGTKEDNNLPDSAFMYVESGEKDGEGKTIPRSKRHLPYKKADGSIDLPRLRNALSRLGQSNTGKVGGESWLTEGLRKRLVAKGERILKNANKSLKDDFRQFFSNLMGWAIKEQEEPEENKDHMMFWKELDGNYRWFATYSNNFRDRDRPAEIIAAESHKRFVENVEKGLLPLPELWLWHHKELKFGQADLVGYDDSGFAFAAGRIDKDKEELAEALSLIDPKEIRVSHGMPKSTIVRDPDDPTVIKEHVTVEISPLPASRAANVLTSFSILESKEANNMPIPENQKKAMEQWGIDSATLEKVEAMNAALAKEAHAEGIESKEKPLADEKPETEPVSTASQAPTQTKEGDSTQAPEQTSPAPLTVEDIAKAVSGALTESLTAIETRFAALEARFTTAEESLKALKETDEEKVTKAVAMTPAASLQALLGTSIARAINSKETSEDGRSGLAKSKPNETKAASSPLDAPNLGVWLMNNALGANIQDEKSLQT